jgi:hypothetical protein
MYSNLSHYAIYTRNVLPYIYIKTDIVLGTKTMLLIVEILTLDLQPRRQPVTQASTQLRPHQNERKI